MAVATAGLALWCGSCGRGPTIDPPTVPEPARAALEQPVRRLFDQALAELEVDRRDGSRWMKLGMAYEANGRVDLALTCYEQAIALDGARAKWWHRAALAHAEAGDLDGALAAMEQAIRRDSSYAPAHWQRGYWLLKRGQLEDAKKAFERALSIDAGDQAAIAGMARIESLSGQPAEAARPREPLSAWHDPWALELEPSRRTQVARLDVAQALVESGRMDEAVRLYRQLLRDYPDSMYVAANLGRVLVEMGQDQEGMRILEGSLRRHPDYYLLHFNIAQSCERMTQRSSGEAIAALRQRALRHLDRVTELNPTFGRAFGLKADLLARQGRIEEALAAARRAHEVEPSTPKWLHRAGTHLMQLQRWEEAAAILRDLTLRWPEEGESLAALGVSLMNLGDLDGAERALGQARELLPKDQHVAEAMEQLRARKAAKGAR
jgi:tetratricopeptide (TPR) repeat protein